MIWTKGRFSRYHRITIRLGISYIISIADDDGMLIIIILWMSQKGSLLCRGCVMSGTLGWCMSMIEHSPHPFSRVAYALLKTHHTPPAHEILMTLKRRRGQFKVKAWIMHWQGGKVRWGIGGWIGDKTEAWGSGGENDTWKWISCTGWSFSLSHNNII